MRGRDNKGRFVRPEYRGLEVKPDKPVKSVPVSQIVIAMVIFFGILVLLDKCKVIDLASIARL